MDSLICASKRIIFYLVNSYGDDLFLSKTYNLKLDGLVCPLPVAKTKKKLNEMEAGEILEVTGDFGESGENIKRYVEKHGDSILDFKIEGDDYYIIIKKV
ncbi:MAG: sulfurtransferase TusA family protein [Candidatus Lokiarchaeota archaeon]|nr:sulfurtransferase TusA family protein [Candidatus Lokiarchaeota archaeon]